MQKYIIERTAAGVVADVHFSEHEGDSSPLKDQHGIGFEMGYSGGGPENLAASILSEAVAEHFSTAFAEEIIADWPNGYQDDPRQRVVVLTQSQVFEWLKNKLLES